MSSTSFSIENFQHPKHTGFHIVDNIVDRFLLKNGSSDRYETNTVVLRILRRC